MAPTPRKRGRAAVDDRARYLRLHPLCVMCAMRGLVIPAEQVDHIQPLSKGGPDSDANKQPLCIECHKAKTASDMGYRQRTTTGRDGWPVDG